MSAAERGEGAPRAERDDERGAGVPASKVTSHAETRARIDERFMERALLLAERGRGRTSPNPMVGAVVVSPEDVVVGSGFHERAGEAHAEVRALSAAGRLASGGTLYTTLEPCCHSGRTGPCTEAIGAAGIRRVVAAIEDPNPRVRSRGFEVLRAQGIAVDVGTGAAPARRLNEAFLTSVQLSRPFVTLKLATSLDGRIAAYRGTRTPLSSEESQRRVHADRAEVDAIAVGSTTILVDDPLLTARGIFRARPLMRVVFDTRLRTPPGARIFSTLDQGPVVLVTTPLTFERERSRVVELKQSGAEFLIVPASDGHADLRSALGELARRGLTSLLLEGGAKIATAAWRLKLIDKLQLYISPRPLGSQGVPWLEDVDVVLGELHDRKVIPSGADVCIEGYVHRPH